MPRTKLIAVTPQPTHGSAPLTPAEIDQLVDYMVNQVDDPRINCALLVLLDEITELAANPNHARSVCDIASRRAYK